MVKGKKISFGELLAVENNRTEDTFCPPRVTAIKKEKYVEVRSNSFTNRDSTIYLGGKNNNYFPFDLKPGKTYTLLLKVKIIERIKVISGNETPRIQIDISQKGKVQWGWKISKTTPNEYGTSYMNISFSIPQEAEGVFIRLSATMLKERGVVAYGEPLLFEGSYNFDFLNSSISSLFDVLNNQIVVNNDNFLYMAKEASQFVELIEESGCEELSERIKDKLLTDNSWNRNNEFLKITQKLAEEGKFEESRRKFFMIPDLSNKLPNISTNQLVNTVKRNIKERYYVAEWLLANINQIREIAELSIAEHTKQELGELGGLPIFVYWGQGFDNAPEIVKSCNRQLRKFVPSQNIHFLTESNIEDYIVVPQHVKKLKESSVAHLSDYYRIALIERWGGAWIDATVFVNNDFFKELEKNLQMGDICFCPRYPQKEELSYSISNWFLAANENNYLIATVRAAISLYMETHDKYSFYYFFHCIFEFLVQIDDNCKKIWEKSPFLEAPDMHELQRKMYLPLQTGEINDIISSHIVNKLTYKYDRNKITLDSTISKIIRKM